MDNNKLALYIALDSSSSMTGTRWTNAIDSINEYINGLKKEKIEGTVNITAFSTGEDRNMRLNTIVADQSIVYYDPITSSTVSPLGGTPLYDAAASVMDRAIANGSKRTIVVIMTDGEENASVEYNRTTIKEKVKAVTDKGWEVVFLGANFDVTTYAQASGLNFTKMRNVDLQNVSQRKDMEDALMYSTVAYTRSGAAIDISADPVVTTKSGN